MYSNRLKSAKIYTPGEPRDTGESCVMYGVDKVNALIDKFCVKEDLIGVPTPELFNLFDEFCVKNGVPKFNHLSLGKVFRKHFNLDRRKVRSGKDLYWVYVDGGKQ